VCNNFSACLCCNCSVVYVCCHFCMFARMLYMCSLPGKNGIADWLIKKSNQKSNQIQAVCMQALTKKMFYNQLEVILIQG